jgi:NAD(P)-dependent dehydrogenase (short-subunit alcohol dehydrogenase family)
MTVKSLDGRVAIVTGSGSGIGRAIAIKLAEHGADVAVVYGHNEANARRTAEMIGNIGRRSCAIGTNVTDATAVSDMVQSVLREWGRIDILVNNAGIVREAAFLDFAEADWDDVLGVNLKGPFLCTQAVARHMVEMGRDGKVVNIGSIDGTGIAVGICSYAVAKMGLIQLTRVAALELAPYGIQVNLVSPGAIAAGMGLADAGTAEHDRYLERIRREVPLGRMGEGEEVADVVLFLASDKGDYVTGSEFVIDGGALLRPYTI